MSELSTKYPSGAPYL